MTTRDFIARTYNTTRDSARGHGERRCSSIFTDDRGVVYSYGYHYPLAFYAYGLDFVNTTKYSVTTSKHTTWAISAIGNKAIGVKLRGNAASIVRWGNEDARLHMALEMLQIEMTKVEERLEHLEHRGHKDTGVYKAIEEHLHQVRANHELVKAAVAVVESPA